MPVITETKLPPSAADLLARIEELGGIDPRRVVLKPLPGTATENDLLRLTRRTDRLYELVDGTLVEKPTGVPESSLVMWLGHLLWQYLAINNIGELIGPDGTLQLMRGLVRTPDVSFIRHAKKTAAFAEGIPEVVPDFVIEVLSPSNTRSEIQRKLKEYFLAGTQLVWLVDSPNRTVRVHTAPDVCRTLTEADVLDGGEVLPGLALPVQIIFERQQPPEVPPPETPRVRKKRPSK